jgi:chromosome segregation ATPase
VENQKEEMKEVQRKNLADQEVIVFLDERVKKLENEVGDIKSKEATSKQEAADVVTKNEKKVRVLSDMLRFEREQMASNEKEWKNTKKLLVKEVKSCRSHIVTLEAELEGMRRQNEQLKEGLRVLSPPKKSLKFR